MPTIADVARKAGVSAPHAARVLSGKGYASAEVRERVLRAAQEIDYVPNRLARGLRSRRTDTIGLVISDVENPFYSQIAKTVETESKERGYHVVLCNSSDDPAEERHYLNLLEALRVDGVIVTPSPGRSAELKRLREGGTVVIQMDRKAPGLKADAVLVANAAGAERAVDHLIENGHRRIGILSGPRTITSGRERLAGFVRALEKHRIRPQEKLMRVGSFQRASAMEDARALLAARPTAIFAANNILAEAVMLVLHGQEARVPDDVSLVAFDDTPWMSLVNPPLTTIRQPIADMARAAVAMLTRRLGDGKASPETVVFEPELVVRGSVATLR
ncbi:MAG TPA: LacI family DNA-binding transcriptional regulator [Gaiellaceae bacterium]|nr:LacI family DNA-binding transcriptional regulator [Gaiellaceae bacterium]